MPRFEFIDLPIVRVLSSTEAVATISAAVVGETVDLSSLLMQSGTPQGILSAWNTNPKA